MQLAVLSNERLNPWVNWTTLGPPLLRPLADHSDARLIQLPPLKFAYSQEWYHALSAIWRSDTLFWMQGSARPENPILAAATARGFVRRSAFVVDAWRHALERIGWAAVFQNLDPCFVAFREGAQELATRFPKGRFEWMPFGVDTNIFDRVHGERDIFAYWMGRRYEPLHQALLAYCTEHSLNYRFTTNGEIADPIELGRIVGRSQYFLVTPPNFDNPARTGGYSPLVMRYLEGLAAGSRLLGVLPMSGEYEALLPLDAILQVAPDGSDLASKLDTDRVDATARRAVERARILVRSHHSWKRRAEQIYARLTDGTTYSFDLDYELRAIAS